MMKNHYSSELVKRSLLSNQCLGAILILAYFVVYGITAQMVLFGFKLFYFLGSVAFAAVTLYVRDPEIQKKRIKQSILANQIIGTALVLSYVLTFGISSVALLSGFQLIFFMSSYIFVMSIFYIRDPERLQKEENISYSASPATERNPCFISNNDLSWFVREINSSLAVMIGFSELLFKRQYTEPEKEYMLRNIYDQALYVSNCLNKVSATITDSPVKPKEIYEVVDLLNDKNFK